MQSVSPFPCEVMTQSPVRSKKGVVGFVARKFLLPPARVRKAARLPFFPPIFIFELNGCGHIFSLFFLLRRSRMRHVPPWQTVLAISCNLKLWSKKDLDQGPVTGEGAARVNLEDLGFSSPEPGNPSVFGSAPSRDLPIGSAHHHGPVVLPCALFLASRGQKFDHLLVSLSLGCRWGILCDPGHLFLEPPFSFFRGSLVSQDNTFPSSLKGRFSRKSPSSHDPSWDRLALPAA